MDWPLQEQGSCVSLLQVQMMRGEFLETALFWAGVVALRLRVVAERKESQHSYIGAKCEFGGKSTSSFHTAIMALIGFVPTLFHYIAQLIPVL